MSSVIARRLELKREDIDLVGKELGPRATAKSIFVFFESRGEPRSRGYCDAVGKTLRFEQQIRIDGLIAALLRTLPMNPSANAVHLAARALGDPGPKTFHVSVHRKLREEHPSLWCEKTEPFYIRTLGESESLCIEKVINMLGSTQVDAFDFVFRSFLVLAYRNPHDIISIALGTQHVSNASLAQLSRLLDMDLTNPAMAKFERVRRAKVAAANSQDGRGVSSRTRCRVFLAKEDLTYIEHFQKLLATTSTQTVGSMLRTILIMATHGRANILELVDTVRQIRMKDISTMNSVILSISIPVPTQTETM